MAQHASEIDESTASEGLHCQQCGDAIPGEPFYPFRDVVRTDGEFTYTEDAEGRFAM